MEASKNYDTIQAISIFTLFLHTFLFFFFFPLSFSSAPFPYSIFTFLFSFLLKHYVYFKAFKKHHYMSSSHWGLNGLALLFFYLLYIFFFGSNLISFKIMIWVCILIESSINFVARRCFLMRSKERVFSKEKQERERECRRNRNGRKRKKVFF